MTAQTKMTAAEFRNLQLQPKAHVQGPAAPSIKGKPQYALGRMPPGVMNKTEARFLEQWIKPLLLSGAVLWWSFEGIKLRLAPATFYTLDFAMMASDGLLDLVDVKASRALIEEDANVKAKVAATLFPFRFFFAWPEGKQGWHLDPVGRG